MNYLWRFYWDCGRQGNVEGLFVATEKEIEELVGKEIYFGEILGKHSEIYGTIEKGEITKVDLDSETVEKVVKVLGNTWGGYNPFDYLEENDDEDSDDENDEDYEEDSDL
jgi:hypothetical protein